MALEDKAAVLQRNLNATDRQQAIRNAKFGAEIERLYETARRLRAKLRDRHESAAGIVEALGHSNNHEHLHAHSVTSTAGSK